VRVDGGGIGLHRGVGARDVDGVGGTGDRQQGEHTGESERSGNATNQRHHIALKIRVMRDAAQQVFSCRRHISSSESAPFAHPLSDFA
jgi:hypothetical protein